jgi:hypothetical protein
MTATIKKPLLSVDMPLSIGVMIPTRGRPHRLAKSIRSVLDMADDPTQIQILMATDVDDTDSDVYIKTNIIPDLEQRGITYVYTSYPRQGYANLHKYYNDLAGYAQTNWLVVWNDDAVMMSKGWDTAIRRYDGEFRVLAFDTHNQHPYSIFPVIPRDWYALLGCISNHQMVDAVVSQMSYMLDIMTRTDIKVEHERIDLVGLEPDATHLERELFENNPSDPRDLNHRDALMWRHVMSDRLAWYLKSRGQDISWWLGVLGGTQDPWQRLKENDVRGQVTLKSTKN